MYGTTLNRAAFVRAFCDFRTAWVGCRAGAGAAYDACLGGKRKERSLQAEQDAISNLEVDVGQSVDNFSFQQSCGSGGGVRSKTKN